MRRAGGRWRGGGGFSEKRFDAWMRELKGGRQPKHLTKLGRKNDVARARSAVTMEEWGVGAAAVIDIKASAFFAVRIDGTANLFVSSLGRFQISSKTTMGCCWVAWTRTVNAHQLPSCSSIQSLDPMITRLVHMQPHDINTGPGRMPFCVHCRTHLSGPV